GYAFCGDVNSEGGAVCLAGNLTTQVNHGFGNFTELFIRHPGPGYVLEFTFQTLVRRTPPFNVLPAPPRLEGVYFSRAFSNVILSFNAPTNRGVLVDGIGDVMGDKTDCSLILTDETLDKMGAGVTCAWETDSVLVALLSSDATILPGDLVGIKAHSMTDSVLVALLSSDATILPGDLVGIKTHSMVTTTMHYQRVMQASTGMVKLQRVFAAAPDGVSLTSPQFVDPMCKPVMIPEQVSDDWTVKGKSEGSAADLEFLTIVSAADLEFFTIDGVDHLVVANFCEGPNCKYDPAVLLTQAEFDIPSNLYRKEASGALTWIQDIPTQGAVDVAAFTVVDTRE
ncbi:hypothetical protein T484DRAFT_1783419, partial [Baffinella frigidus]